MNKRNMDFSTRLMHGGYAEQQAENALSPPLYQTSTFTFRDVAHLDRVMAFESPDCVYTRGNNPTLKEFEHLMAQIEGGAQAVAFASGMAAISSVLLSLLSDGGRLLMHRTVYGSTWNLAHKVLTRYGVAVTSSDLRSVDGLDEALVDDAPTVVYLETPSNPNLDIIDVARICDAAHARGALVVVDNTFATPYGQNPLALGADVVVHSATKYLCGHGDAIGGVAVVQDASYAQRLKFEFMSELGGALSPFNAWLILRGMKTLNLRMERHMESAMDLAQRLAADPEVTDVLYPGLASFPGHEIAKRQMRGFGGMLSFVLRGGRARARSFLDALDLIAIAVSLGDCETLIEMPADMTHRGHDQEALAQQGMTDSMVRLSVGLESVEDLWSDLEQALRATEV